MGTVIHAVGVSEVSDPGTDADHTTLSIMILLAEEGKMQSVQLI